MEGNTDSPLAERWPISEFGQVSYASRVLRNGSIIHHVSGVHSKDVFSVIVAVRFGAVHLDLQNTTRETLQLPPGMPHLAEHVLHEMTLRNPPFKWLNEIVGSLNARVDRERTLWWVRGQPTGRGPHYSQPARIAKGLVEVCTSGVAGELDHEMLLDRAKRIVYLEKGYRQSIDWLSARMLDERLFDGSPLSVDPIGETDRLAAVGSEELHASLSAIASTVVSITVLGGEPRASILDSVEDAVGPILNRGYTGWRPVRIPELTPRDTAFAEINGIPEGARVSVAIALSPICGIADEVLRARRAMLSLLLDRHAYVPVSSDLGESAHVFGLDSPVEVPWVARERADVWLRYVLENRLANWASEFADRMRWAGRSLGSLSAMAKLAQLADTSKLTAPALLEALANLTKEDVIALIADLREPLRVAQVYYGPALPSSR
jgi:hypothetical protein